jgi:excisionase family DNA binding protein
MSELLAIDKAAALVGVSRRTLYREIADGRLRVTKVRGSSFISTVELERYVAQAERRRRRLA